jgi:hypothetical protein
MSVTASPTNAALDSVLSSISRAKESRAVLERDFRRLNTFEYQILEAGAEALAIVSLLCARASGASQDLWRCVQRNERVLDFYRRTNLLVAPVLVHVRRVAAFAPRLLPPPTNAQAEARIAQLQTELLALRAELSRLQPAAAGSANQSSRPLAASMVTPAKEPAPAPAVLPAPPLPFNANMLSSVRLRKAESEAEPPSGKAVGGGARPTKEDESMQAVLQRVLAAKFKNARGSPEQLTAYESNAENAVRSAPSVPPRPKIAKTVSSQGSVLSARNR